jgi:hypothetical protein
VANAQSGAGLKRSPEDEIKIIVTAWRLYWGSDLAGYGVRRESLHLMIKAQLKKE